MNIYPQKIRIKKERFHFFFTFYDLKSLQNRNISLTFSNKVKIIIQNELRTKSTLFFDPTFSVY